MTKEPHRVFQVLDDIPKNNGVEKPSVKVIARWLPNRQTLGQIR